MKKSLTHKQRSYLQQQLSRCQNIQGYIHTRSAHIINASPSIPTRGNCSLSSSTRLRSQAQGHRPHINNAYCGRYHGHGHGHGFGYGDGYARRRVSYLGNTQFMSTSTLTSIVVNDSDIDEGLKEAHVNDIHIDMDTVVTENQNHDLEAEDSVLGHDTGESDSTSCSNSSISSSSTDGNSLLSLLSDNAFDDALDDDEISIGSESGSTIITNMNNSDTDDEDKDTKSKKKKLKAKKKRKKRARPKASKLIQRVPTQQSKVNAQLLFDYIAPHVDEETLRMLLAKMQEFEVLMEEELKDQSKSKKKNRKTKKRQLKEYQTLVGRVDAFFSSKKVRGRKGKQQLENANCLAKHPWIKSLVAQFFAGAAEQAEESDSSDANANANANANVNENNIEKTESRQNKLRANTPLPLSMELLWRDPTYTPNINRKKRKEVVSTLMRAREMSLESPLLWSKKQRSKNQRRKNKQKKADEEKDLLRRDAHYGKSADQLKEEAEVIASLLSFRTPENAHDDLIDLFRNYWNVVSETLAKSDHDENGADRHKDEESRGESDDEDEAQDKEHVEIMKMLFPNVYRRTGSHVHFIAAELADFFYVELPDQMRGRIPSSDSPKMSIDSMGKGDRRINDSWNRWNALRDELVGALVSSQHMYVRLQSTVKKAAITVDEDKYIVSKEIAENEVETMMIKYHSDVHKRAEDLIEELDRLRTNADGEQVGRSPLTTQKPGRAPKGAHLQFECLMLHDKFGPYSSANTAFLADLDNTYEELSSDIKDHLPDTNRIIFVDNLPIDITREELEYLYSRCGSVESIDIFNLKPDLDPGELNFNEIKRRQKKNRLSGARGATQNLNNRSPIYAIIKFEDEDGYKRASADMLRIFGMTIHHQPAKSHPARRIHTLFIEDIPDGRFAMDLEEQLSKVLHPDMYISLQLSQHINSQPKSCEIAFPTFEVAHYAYQRLQKLDFGDNKINVHWMKTPGNAMAFWTREQGPNIK